MVASAITPGVGGDAVGEPFPVSAEDIYLIRHPRAYALQRAEGFHARPHPDPWPLALPLDWSADPFANANWCFQLHAWRMTDPILQEYFDRGGDAQLREAFAFALDWHRFHLREGKEAGFSWNDMATGIRAMRIAVFLERAAAGALVLSNSERTALDELADAHALRLSDESFFAPNNHGIFQAFGLNLLCSAAAEREAMRGGRLRAEEMLDELVRLQFTSEAVHTEHSPAYHDFAVRRLERLGIRRHFANAPVKEIVARAAEVTGWFVYPNKAIARLGDSVGMGVPLAAARPTPLPDGRDFWVGDFSKSGYAIVRDAHRDGKSMLFLTGMAYSSTHKHADDLSVELFEHGRFALVDTGKYAYRSDPKRAYAWSAAAHNTISLKERPVRRRDLRHYGSALSPVASGEGGFRLAGAIQRPGLFTQRREIVYDPGRLLVISDELSSHRSWTYMSHLHLAPDLRPELDGRTFHADLGEGGGLGAMLVSPRGSIRAARGESDPMLGWVTRAYGELEPTTTISAECPGRDRTITWAIWFGAAWREAAIAMARQLDAAPRSATGGEG